MIARLKILLSSLFILQCFKNPEMNKTTENYRKIKENLNHGVAFNLAREPRALMKE